MPEGRA